MSSTAIPAALDACQVRSAAFLLLLAPVPFVCMAAVLLDVAAAAGFALLALAIGVIWSAGRQDSGTAAALLQIFLVAAICHAVVGYLIAGPTSRLIWIGTQAANAYAQAFVIISAGIVATAVGYALAAGRQKHALCAVCRRLQFDERRVVTVARLLIIPGVAIIALVYLRIGLIPLLASSPGRARYFNYQLSDDYLLYEWLVSRGLDLLTFSLPIVIASALWNRKWLDGLLALAGAAAFLVPLRRANVMSVVIVLVLMHWLKAGKTQLKYAAMLLVLVAAYAASQLVLINIVGLADFDAETGFAVAGSALSEVRDLGWTIDLLDGERLNGATFVQALVPLPSLMSEFSQRHSLRAVTSQLIGLDAERRTGGLRLTLAGEAYLNFGYFGPVAVCLLLGVGCAYLQAAIRELARHQTMWAYYVSGVVFVWVCFWLYLGGTQAAATIKVGTALLFVTLYGSRVPRGRAAEAVGQQ